MEISLMVDGCYSQWNLLIFLAGSIFVKSGNKSSLLSRSAKGHADRDLLVSFIVQLESLDSAVFEDEARGT